MRSCITPSSRASPGGSARSSCAPATRDAPSSPLRSASARGAPKQVARQRRRERLATATLRLAAGLKANAQAHRARIARARERTTALAERARRAVLHAAAPAGRRGRTRRPAAWRRCRIAACWRAALRWCGIADGQPLRTAAAVGPGMPLDIEFSDGHVRARAEASIRGAGAGAGSPRQCSGPSRRSRGGAATRARAACSELAQSYPLPVHGAIDRVIRSAHQPFRHALERVGARGRVGADMGAAGSIGGIGEAGELAHRDNRGDRTRDRRRDRPPARRSALRPRAPATICSQAAAGVQSSARADQDQGRDARAPGQLAEPPAARIERDRRAEIRHRRRAAAACGRTAHSDAIPPFAQPSSETRSLIDPGLGLQPVPRRIGVGDALARGAHLALAHPALRAAARASRSCRGTAPPCPAAASRSPQSAKCGPILPDRLIRLSQPCSATTPGNGPAPSGRNRMPWSVASPCGMSTCSAAAASRPRPQGREPGAKDDDQTHRTVNSEPPRR